MRKGRLRRRLRSLRSLPHRRRGSDPLRWLNDAPRPPPIAATERISDASSTNYADLTLEERRSTSDPTRLSNASVDRVCLICLEDLPQGSRTTRLPCKHAAWHPKCVATWLLTSPRCPLCQQQISLKRPCYRERYNNPELTWALHDRRFPEQHRPSFLHSSSSSEESRYVPSTRSPHALPWLLDERRLSRVARPNRLPFRTPRSATRVFRRSITTGPLASVRNM